MPSGEKNGLSEDIVRVWVGFNSFWVSHFWETLNSKQQAMQALLVGGWVGG